MAIFNLAVGVAAHAARLAPEGSALHTLGTGMQAWRRGQAVADLIDNVVDTAATTAPAVGAPRSEPAAADDAPGPDAESGGLLDVIVDWVTGER
jgi:hypothetical protein